MYAGQHSKKARVSACLLCLCLSSFLAPLAQCGQGGEGSLGAREIPKPHVLPSLLAVAVSFQKKDKKYRRPAFRTQTWRCSCCPWKGHQGGPLENPRPGAQKRPPKTQTH